MSLIYSPIYLPMMMMDEKRTAKGKSILRAVLVMSAICVFAYLYALIREPLLDNAQPPHFEMGQVHLAFACFVLLLVGMPVLR